MKNMLFITEYRSKVLIYFFTVDKMKSYISNILSETRLKNLALIIPIFKLTIRLLQYCYRDIREF